MGSPRDTSWSESKKEGFIAWLAMLGGAALCLWALCVSLGTGIGYDHPVYGLFDGGVLAAVWRLAKAVFLGVLGWATIHTAIEAVENAQIETRRQLEVFRRKHPPDGGSA